MAATLKGNAVVWGVSGTSYTGGIVSATTAAYEQSLTVNRTAQTKTIGNGVGETVGIVIYDPQTTVRVTVVPYHATTISSAQTSMVAWTPVPGTIVTIADTVGNAEGSGSGAFVVLNATQNRTSDGFATVDLELTSYEANNVTTTVS